ncbi:MAG: hypothetical protein ACXWJZ_04590, partial [Burkholderiaceae bacterium]
MLIQRHWNQINRYRHLFSDDTVDEARPMIRIPLTRSMSSPALSNSLSGAIGSSILPSAGSNRPNSRPLIHLVNQRRGVVTLRLARLLNENTTCKHMGMSFSVQWPGMCLQNTNKAFLKFAGTPGRRLWPKERPTLIEASTSSKDLMAYREMHGPFRILLWGAGKNYPGFHAMMVAEILEVDGIYYAI